MLKNTKNILIFSFTAFLLGACSGDDAGGGSSKSNNGYSAEATKIAVEQCTQSGAPEAMCQCVTKEIQAKISADQMKQIEADIAAGKAVGEEFAKVSADAGLKCVQAGQG